MTSKKRIVLLSLIIIIVAYMFVFGIIYLVERLSKRTNYDELTYYDFNISYDDDNYCYEIFTEDKKYIIHESKLDIKYGNETFIVIFDNNYDWFYNKAILVIGVKGNDE